MAATQIEKRETFQPSPLAAASNPSDVRMRATLASGNAVVAAQVAHGSAWRVPVVPSWIPRAMKENENSQSGDAKDAREDATLAVAADVDLKLGGVALRQGRQLKGLPQRVDPPGFDQAAVARQLVAGPELASHTLDVECGPGLHGPPPAEHAGGADDLGDGRGACLELVRQVRAGEALGGDIGDHATAAEEWRHGFEQLTPPPECADARRAGANDGF